MEEMVVREPTCTGNNASVTLANIVIVFTNTRQRSVIRIRPIHWHRLRQSYLLTNVSCMCKSFSSSLLNQTPKSKTKRSVSYLNLKVSALTRQT